MRKAFTILEMTIVIAILAILVSMAIPVYVTALNQSKGMRTQAVIAKIDSLIMEKWESYQTRQVPIKIPSGRYANGQPYMQAIGEPFADTLSDAVLTNGFRDNSEVFADQPYNGGPGNGVYDLGTAEFRLLALRELQRLELPDRKSDVANDPLVMPFGPPGIIGNRIMTRPSISRQYLNRALRLSPAVPPDLNFWTPQYEGAECLYLILASSRDGDKSSLDFFSPTEIGDFDNDGMKEILDSWGRPIEFVRWPLGYSEDTETNPLRIGASFEWGMAGVDDDNDGIVDNYTEVGWPNTDDRARPETAQSRNPVISGRDQFDPLLIDGRIRSANKFVAPVMLLPLVYSPGPDGDYCILGQNSSGPFPDPYYVNFAVRKMSAGSRFDPNGRDGFSDNITNHSSR